MAIKQIQPRYGYLRPIIPEVVSKFLDCGDLEHGFARVRCDKAQYIIRNPFSRRTQTSLLTFRTPV